MKMHRKSIVAFSRQWAMPSAWTFTIPPIKELLRRYVGGGEGWIDPFAGNNSPADFINHMTPERSARYHVEAFEFCRNPPVQLFVGVLFIRPIAIDKSANTTEESERQRALSTRRRIFTDP